MVNVFNRGPPPGDLGRYPTDALPTNLSAPLQHSPYQPPTESSAAADPVVFDGDPLDNPRLLVWVLRVLSLLLVPLGLLSMLGALSLLTGDTSNPELYELFIVPAMACGLSVPVLLVSVFVYRKCLPDISLPDRIWFNGWAVLPWLGMGLSILSGFVRA